MAYVDLSTLHTPTPGGHPPATWGVQVRDNCDFLFDNRREICTSSTRPTGFEGLEIFETDTDRAYLHDGSDWVPWGNMGVWVSVTPTLVQTGAVTKTTTYARYVRQGRFVHYQGLLAVTGTGTSTSAVVVGTAGITAAQAGSMAVGAGYIYDSSGNLRYPAVVVMATTTTLQFAGTNTTSPSNLGAVDFTAALASGDAVTWDVRFEAAS